MKGKGQGEELLICKNLDDKLTNESHALLMQRLGLYFQKISRKKLAPYPSFKISDSGGNKIEYIFVL